MNHILVAGKRHIAPVFHSAVDFLTQLTIWLSSLPKHRKQKQLNFKQINLGSAKRYVIHPPDQIRHKPATPSQTIPSSPTTPVIIRDEPKRVPAKGKLKALNTPTREGLVGNYLGWRYYPFSRPFAEDELSLFQSPDRTRKGIPASFSPVNYFVDPVYEKRRDGWVLDELRLPEPALIFGKHGTGKSMLRLATEMAVRGRFDESLAVTYKPATRHEVDRSGSEISLDAHLIAIVQEMTVDLFIQIIERFNVAKPPPSPRQNNELCNLLRRLDQRTQSYIIDLINEIIDPKRPAPDSLWGYAEIFPERFSRNRVRPVHRSDEMVDWMSNLTALRDEPSAKAKSSARHESDDLPVNQLAEALGTARLWGFKRAIIFVDNVDDHNMAPQQVWPLVSKLVQSAEDIADQEVYLKLFLPASLEYSVKQMDTLRIHTIHLQWTEPRLRALLRERFRAVGSHRHGFEDLAEPALEHIDDRLLAEADGSPRRLIRLVDELFASHVRRLSEESLEYGAPILASDLDAAISKVRKDEHR